MRLRRADVHWWGQQLHMCACVCVCACVCSCMCGCVCVCIETVHTVWLIAPGSGPVVVGGSKQTESSLWTLTSPGTSPEPHRLSVSGWPVSLLGIHRLRHITTASIGERGSGDQKRKCLHSKYVSWAIISAASNASSIVFTLLSNADKMGSRERIVLWTVPMNDSLYTMIQCDKYILFTQHHHSPNPLVKILSAIKLHWPQLFEPCPPYMADVTKTTTSTANRFDPIQ